MKKRLLWMVTTIMTCGLAMTSCSNDDDEVVPLKDDVEAQLSKMTSLFVQSFTAFPVLALRMAASRICTTRTLFSRAERSEGCSSICPRTRAFK